MRPFPGERPVRERRCKVEVGSSIPQRPPLRVSTSRFGLNGPEDRKGDPVNQVTSNDGTTIARTFMPLRLLGGTALPSEELEERFTMARFDVVETELDHGGIGHAKRRYNRALGKGRRHLEVTVDAEPTGSPGALSLPRWLPWAASGS